MEVTGRVIKLLPVASGTSARTGNPWMSQEFVLETHDQYPKKICIRMYGEDKIKNLNIKEGEEVTVSFDIDAHEYNGRWYNTLSAWNVTRGDAGAPQPQQQQTAAAPQQQAAPAPQQPGDASSASVRNGGNDVNDDLPF